MYSYPSSAAPAQSFVTQPAMSAPPGMPAMAPPGGMAPPMMGSPTPAIPSGSTSPAQTYQGPPAGQSSSMSYPATPIPDNDPKTNPINTPSLNPQTRTTSAKPLLGPAWVTNAIFRTADRATVFHPAVETTIKPQVDATPAPQNDGWSGTAMNNDGWQPTNGR